MISGFKKKSKRIEHKVKPFCGNYCGLCCALSLGVHLYGISFFCRRGCVRQHIQLDAIQDGLIQYRHFAARGQHRRQGPRLCDDGRQVGTDCAQDRVYAIVVNGHMTMTSTSVALLNIVANDWPLTEDAIQCQVPGNGMLLQVIRCS